MTSEGRPIEVLLVEDDQGDILLTREAFELNKVRNRLHVVNDGEQAMAYLRQEDDYAEATRPDLILLDLNLPDIPGDVVLRNLRHDPDLRDVPVVMISGDAIPSQVQRVLDLGAAAYITKPFDIQELLHLVDSTLEERTRAGR